MNRFFRINIIPALLLAGMLALTLMEAGCKKEQLLQSGGDLRFSADTVLFDTVFTAEGSFTIPLKIYNPQDQKITISSVRLEKGSASQFHLNVDGFPGSEVNNIEVAANDSIYVFATVNVNPDNQNDPFVVEDKLIATLNGKDFSLPLIAFGQNAHYVVDSVLQSQTWLTDKPYVIIHSALVDSLQTLTIPAGCRVYMHADSRLLVKGTLKINGTLHDSVMFQGDRLDRNYFGNEGYPGEWGGFYFTEHSIANEMHHVIIRNCGNSALGAVPAAIQVNPDLEPDNVPQLYLDRVIVENSIGYGLLSFGGTVKAENCLIQTCGAQALAMVQGGNDTFINCTFAVYGTDKVSHVDNATAILLNYYKLDDTHIVASAMNALLTNCVIYGSLQNELIIDSISAAACNIRLDHCLIKADPASIPAWVVKSNVQFNTDPLFVDVAKWNFRPKAGSPMIDAGVYFPISSGLDLDDNPRVSGGSVDIGCYEFH